MISFLAWGRALLLFCMFVICKRNPSFHGAKMSESCDLVNKLYALSSCCTHFPGETWINECVSVHSRGVTVSREWPKMHFCSSLAQWASESIGATPRTRMTPANPSIRNDFSGSYHLSPPKIHRQIQQVLLSSLFLLMRPHRGDHICLLGFLKSWDVEAGLLPRVGSVSFGRKQPHSKETVSHRFCYLKGNAFWEAQEFSGVKAWSLIIHRASDQWGFRKTTQKTHSV